MGKDLLTLCTAGNGTQKQLGCLVPGSVSLFEAQELGTLRNVTLLCTSVTP